MKSIDSFIKVWDNRIIDWFNSPDQTVNYGIESNFYKGKNKSKLDCTAFPEPYLGDPHKASCVIINLNPGNKLDKEQDIYTGSFVNAWKDSKCYYEFAKSFPYLKPECKTGFWVNRRKWIDRLLALHQKKSNLNPFALEIIPFHSKSFGLLSYNNELQEYLNNELFPVAEEASLHAELNLILTIGKSFYNIFEWLSFKKIIEYNPEYHPDITYWPIKENGVKLNRNFSIWKSPKGILYYNTWHSGGNKMPAELWLPIEKTILQKEFIIGH